MVLRNQSVETYHRVAAALSISGSVSMPLLAQKQQLLKRLEGDPGPNERERSNGSRENRER
jgi:hypothetical protein